MKIVIHQRLCILLGVLLACLACRATDKPNFLFIFADDMSYETVGAAGYLDIDTPHIDSLAENGTSFLNTYNMGSWSGAVCVASRTMLNTGKFLWQARMLDKRPALNHLAAEGATWSQRMAEAGYRTYLSGKWHINVAPETIFDVVKNERPGMPNQTPEGYDRPKSPEDYASGWKPWDTKHRGFWKGGRHWSEVLAEDTIAFLEAAAADGKPFFMYIAFNAPHDPRQSPKEYIDRYPLERIALPENFLPEYPYAEAICGKKLRDERLAPYPRTEYAVKVNRQEYFALVTHMDDQIGKILKALKDTGQADNTYIVFTADHGLAVGHHGLIGKQNQYEHSVKVPFIVVGPEAKPGSLVDADIYLQDAMATALDLAGNLGKDVDFKSVMPLLKGERTQHYDSIYGAYLGTQRMIKEGEWKLIAYPTIGVKRLFNLKADPTETNDLAANPEYASVLLRLTQLLEAEMDALGDSMTSLAKADYDGSNGVIKHSPGQQAKH